MDPLLTPWTGARSRMIGLRRRRLAVIACACAASHLTLDPAVGGMAVQTPLGLSSLAPVASKGMGGGVGSSPSISSRIKLTVNDEVLAVFKDGVLMYRVKNPKVSHKEIIRRWARSPRPQLAPPLLQAVEVITIRKLANGKIMAFRSKAFYGREALASMAAINAARQIYK